MLHFISLIHIISHQHEATEDKPTKYKEYIAFEMKGGDPARIQCIFERAIKDHCLEQEFWANYTNYLVCVT